MKFRQLLPLRIWVSLTVLVTVCGCAEGLLSMPGTGWMSGKMPSLRGKKDKETASKKKEEDNDFGSRNETPLLNEYISVHGNTLVVLRGVGLVTGLDGTGDDPPPSPLRTALREEMTRRGIKNPNQILSSKNTTLVVVTALLPAMVREGQHFDVRVALPPNSKATSLKGGWLLETRLFEEQTVEGRGTLKGHEYGIASGAILTALGASDDRTETPALLRRGSIPGGAVSRTNRDLSMVLRTEKRGVRNSKRVANAVSERFNHYNRFGQRVALAEAKDDVLLTLKMHPTYRNNFPRYQQVIRSIAFNESDVARRIRMEQLAEDVFDPSTASQAALQLEAIGEAGIPFLKDALESEDFEVQFQAAQALAYLGDPSGLAVLKRAVKEQPAFRAYSLAAMSVVDDADSVIALRELMSEPELEIRYGAFRALQELDENDPSLHRVDFDNRFQLFLIESSGEPMSHVTRRRAPEIVLFGVDQAIRLPAILNIGRSIRMIGEAGSHTVTISKYELGKEEPERREVSNKLADIIRTAGELGATYPDIVQLMIEAEQQHNLQGKFGIDTLPQAGRLYLRETESGVGESSKKIGSEAMVPTLFDKLDEDELREQQSDEKLSSLKFENLDEESSEDSSDGKSGKKKSSDSEDSNEKSSSTSDQGESKESDSGAAGNKSADSVSAGDSAEESDASAKATADLGDSAADPAEESSSDEDTLESDTSDAESTADGDKPGLGAKVKGFFTNPLGKK